jgi:transcriptional regulator with XRE-family HTH domain
MASTSLGAIIKRIRRERNWKLADMSAACGIPLSTLSKIENDKLSLTYDKLQAFARALDIPLADLFADAELPGAEPARVTARRSIATLATAVKVDTPNYEYSYFCTDLRHRLMIPIHTRITAKSLEDFGPLLRHGGEEFVYVVDGAVTVHTEFYAPTLLARGEGIYIDSSMGHAFVVADGFDEAAILVITASPDAELARQLIAEAEGRNALPAPATRDGEFPPI